jgi:penicillin-binding protein 2
VQEFPPRVKRLITIDPGYLAQILSGLRGVVAEKEGTAHAGTVEGADMAGKTGTAQVSHGTPRGVDPGKVWYFNRDHAWFAGYAPAEAPEIAIVVLVEHGGGGGKNAVPVASRVVRDWQKLREQRKNPDKVSRESANEDEGT